MRAELAPLGITVTVVEPGYFRTGFLNPTAQVKSEKILDVYERSAVGEIRKTLAKVDNNQPGDVVKGAKILIDILTKAGGKDVPMRVVLGSDAPGVVRGKCENTIKLLEEWDGITNKTDHE